MIKKRNKYSDEEFEYLNYCKQLVFDVLNAENIESAKKGRNYLISIQDKLPKLFLIKLKISFKKFSSNILKKH